MTSGAGNSINLASMWVPVMPETSHLDGKLREAGEKGRRAFEEGFGSGGSPEALGLSFADKFSNSFSNRFRSSNIMGADLMGSAVDKLGEQVDSKLAAKLKGQLPQAYRAVTQAQQEYRNALAQAQPYQQREAELTERITALKQEHARVSAQTTQLFSQATAARQANNSVESDWIGLQTKASESAQRSNGLLQERNVLERQLASTLNTGKSSEENLATTRLKAAEAQGNYTQLVERHSQATKRAFDSSSMFAGMLGGAMVLGLQAVSSAFMGVIELGEHVFEGAVEGATELGKKLVEIGEDYQQLNIQVESYSSASGEALAQFQDDASKVFAGLDVAGKDTGKTIAQLSSMLGIGSSQALRDLTHNIEELQGRFTGLKANDLGSIFRVFKTGSDDLNSSLATLLRAGQDSGRGLAEIVNAMSGDAAVTLQTAGFSLGQVAHFVGELGKTGLPAKSVMMGLNASMKVFGKQGLDFRGGITEAIKELSALGNTAAGDALAEKLFGGRRWTEVMQMIPALKGLISSTADSFDAPEDALHQFLDDTETLANHIEAFKHNIEDAFKPFGEKAKDAVEHGLGAISGWFDQHHDQIINDINQWGHDLINLVPTIKDFVDTAITLFQALVWAMEPVAGMTEIIAGGMDLMRGNFKEGLHLMDQGENLEKGAITGGGPLVDFFDKLKGKVNSAFDKVIDKSGDLGNALDNLTDSAKNMPSYAGSFTPPPFMIPKGLPPSGPGPSGPEYTWSTPNHQPTMPGNAPAAPGTHSLPVNPFTGPPGGNPTAPGQLPSIAPQDKPSGYTGPSYSGDHSDLWIRVAKAESSGNWSNEDTGHNGHFGGLQFAPDTWKAFGGLEFADRADHASPDEQMIVADRTAFTGYGGVAPQGLGAWETITNGSVPISGYGGGKIVGAQFGGFARGFDNGGTGDGRSWTDHAIDTAKFLGDDALSWAALAGRGALSGAGTLGKLAARAAGPLGMVLPLAVEAISPSAHASTSDTTPFNPGRKAPGATRGGKRLQGNRMAGNVTNSGDQGTGGSGSSVFPDWWQKIIDSPNDVVPGWMVPGFDLDPRIQRGIGGGGNRPDPWNIMPNAPGRETGGRGPKDTLPVWVTPNEYIWNDEAVDKYGWLIHPLNEEAQGRGTGVSSMFRNAKGFQGGGGTGAADYAASGRGNDMPELVDPQLQAVTGIANSQFGLTLTAGKSGHGTHDIDKGWHDSGQAGDFGNGYETPQELAFAQAMFTHFGSQLSELIYAGPGMPKLIKDGQPVDPMFYGADTLAGHHDHVHVAIKSTQTLSDAMSPGSEPIVAGQAGGFGATPMGFGTSPAGWGGGGGGFGGGGGMPGDPSQMTPQQFEQWNTQRERQRSLRGANDRVGDLEKERDRLEKVEIPKAKKELEDEKNLPPLGQTPGKTESLQDALDRLTERLTKITGRELPEAQEDLQADVYKANQPMKTPGGQDKGGDAAKDFGSKFLGGIAQSLGFPDVFGGKAPWDFGIVKALGRFTTGFMGGMQQQQQGGGGPGYGGGGMPGMSGLGSPTSFLDGLSGMKLPGNAFQGGVPSIAGGPNTYATGPTPHMPGGPGPGGATSPGAGAIHIGNQDNSVNVYPATDKETKSGLQSYQNSYGRAQLTAASTSFGDIPSTLA